MSENDDSNNTSSIIFRKPQPGDGIAVYKLVDASKPLDLNSLYSYLLICAHHDTTSVVVESDGEITGYISGYRHPKKDDTLFVWQVAVSKTMRKMGLARKMILDILSRSHLDGIQFIETTVTPSNSASRGFFRNLASHLETECNESDYFSAEMFGGEEHEPEDLFRIGPFSSKIVRKKNKEEQ